MTEAPQSYEAAVERLEQIIDRLDSGQAGLRETLELCREGRGLVEYCAGELDAVGEGLRELRLDELAARLETDPPAADARASEQDGQSQ
jgi:exodeoxyribonuclease VII small subunit